MFLDLAATSPSHSCLFRFLMIFRITWISFINTLVKGTIPFFLPMFIC